MYVTVQDSNSIINTVSAVCIADFVSASMSMSTGHSRTVVQALEPLDSILAHLHQLWAGGGEDVVQ